MLTVLRARRTFKTPGPVTSPGGFRRLEKKRKKKRLWARESGSRGKRRLGEGSWVGVSR